MNKFFKVVAVVAAGVALACLAPTQIWAACPGSVPFTSCQSAGGGTVRTPAGNGVGGTYWIAGTGLDAQNPLGDTAPGFGNDAGTSAGFPLPLDGSMWLLDFGIPELACMNWDWQNPTQDGCGDGTAVTPMVVVMRDDGGKFAIMQVSPAGTAYDFDTINNGIPAPQGGTANNGVVMQKAVRVTSSSDLGTTVGATVAPLNVTQGQTRYDDLGGTRNLPGTVRLRGRQGGVTNTLGAAGAGGTFNVDADSSICWELVDAGYTVTLGCQAIGGNTPSQNVINGKAGFAKGGAAFSWDVTAQFDVLGFNIYQKNVTKGTDRKINDGLIALSGDNDATAESYNFLAPRSDLRAWKGGFEIELVRQNGETSRAPVTLTK
jgi:hypothetical protein